MKKNILLLITLSLFGFSAFSQIGIGTNSPNPSAQLEVSSTNKGFLPPQIALLATNNASPVTAPASGLLIYNTATAGVAPYNVAPGYYYWDGSSWYPVENKGTSFGDMQYWNGTKWVLLNPGNEGDHMVLCNGKPSWGDCTKTMTMQPGPIDGLDARVFVTHSCSPGSPYENIANTNGGNLEEINMTAWTFNSVGCPTGEYRNLLKFSSIDSIPANAIIVSARLSLYGVSSSTPYNTFNSYYPGSPYNGYGTNEVLIKRLTGPWTESTVTWNTQPGSVTTNQVVIPFSTSQWNYDVVDLDITNLVKDIKASTNYGFLLQIQTETYYRSMNFVSSDGVDAAKRPKLVVAYQLP